MWFLSLTWLALPITPGPSHDGSLWWVAIRYGALRRASMTTRRNGCESPRPTIWMIPAIFAGPGSEEAAMAAPLIAALPGAIDLCGRLSLPEVAACFGRVALYIGNDSGLMHLAAAAGAPTLGLFGPTPAAEYGPSGPRAAAVLSGDGTMAGLTVADALAAATKLLERAATIPVASRKTPP